MTDTGNVITFRRQPRFLREPFEEIAPRGEEYIVKGLIPAHGVGFINGPSGARKTFLALDWALRLAGGEDILGRRTRQVGAIFIAAEAPNGVRKRVAAWRLSKSQAPRPFEMIAQAPDLRNTAQVEELAAEIALAAEEMRPARLGLVVLDTLAASIPGADENGALDMSTVMANAHGLASASGAFVLIVSHTGKDEARGVRGWSGQHAAADAVISLSREEGGDLTEGRLVKLKEGEDGARFAFRLEQVSLGEDADGDPITSAVVIYEDAPEAVASTRRRRPMNDAEQLILRAIGHVTDHGSTHPAPANAFGVKPGQLAVTRADVKARALASGFASDVINEPTKRQQFSRAIQGLTALGKIRVEGVSIWAL